MLDSTYYSHSQIGRVDGDGVRIFFKRDVYNSIFKKAKGFIFPRTFGLLLGSKIKKDGGFIVHIDHIYPLGRLKHGKNPRALSPKGWEPLQNKVYNYYPGGEILGWYGVRRGWSAMLTEDDQRIHREFFTKSWHIIYLLDDVDESSNFFHWEGDRLKSSNGYYTYWGKDEDRRGKKGEKKKEAHSTNSRGLITGLTVVVAAVLILILLSQNRSHLFPFGNNKGILDEDTSDPSIPNQNIYVEEDDKDIENSPIDDDQEDRDRIAELEKELVKRNREIEALESIHQAQVSEQGHKTGNNVDTERGNGEPEARDGTEESEGAKEQEVQENSHGGPKAKMDGARIYIIQKGDNLYKISEKFYGTDRYGSALAKINRIQDQRSLRIGSYIIIPTIDEIENMKE